MSHIHIADAELTIMQAPMAGVQDTALAITVNSAGGLGSLPCAMLSPSQLAAELQALKQAKGAAIHANFFFHAVRLTMMQIYRRGGERR